MIISPAIILFQITIFITIFLAWRNKTVIGIIVSGLWFYHTYFELWGTLQEFQLIIVFISTVIAYLSISNSNLIGKFINNLLGLSQVKGPFEHREFLLKTVKRAKKDLILLSGWATSFALDDQLVKLLKNAVSRGVNIYICFGYKYSRGTSKRISDIKGLETLRDLQMYSNNNKSFGNMFIAQIPNHSKILMCDKEYYVVGSFNWLSNSGSTENPNDETSVVIRNLSLILNNYDELTKQIIENAE